MASRLEEYLKNASPEVRAAVEKSAQAIEKHRQELQNESKPIAKEGDRSGTDGLVKNLSPEAQATVLKSGQTIEKHHHELRSETNPGFKDVSDRSDTPGRIGPSRPHAAAPEPSHGPSDQKPQSRIDQAMDQRAQALAAEQGNQALKSGASIEQDKTSQTKAPEKTSTKEPER